MKTMSVSATQFCQVENVRKRISFAFLRKTEQVVRYLFWPEDSRDTVYHAGQNRVVSRRLALIKTGFWVILAIFAAIFIAQLQ